MDLFLGDCGWCWMAVECGKFIWGLVGGSGFILVVGGWWWLYFVW